MFEKKIAFETETILQLAAEDSGKTYLPDLLENNFLPESLKKFAASEINWWIYEERIQRQLHPNFDTTAPEIVEIFDKLDDLYRKYAVFNYKKLEKLVKSYISLRLNYLTRPRNTLIWFVFRGEPTKPGKEVLMRLDHFIDYPYMPEELRSSYSGVNDDDLITVSDFARSVEEIDNEYIYTLSPADFISLLDPLYEFFGNGETGEPEIPVEALIIFLDDKGLTPMARSLEKLLRSEHIKLISKSEFADFIDTILNEIDTVEKRHKEDSAEDRREETRGEPDEEEPEIEPAEEYTEIAEEESSAIPEEESLAESQTETEELTESEADINVSGEEKSLTDDVLSLLSEESEEIEPIEEDEEETAGTPPAEKEEKNEAYPEESETDLEEDVSEVHEDEEKDQHNFEQEAIANAESGAFIKVADAPSPEFMNKEFRINLPEEKDQPFPVSELKEYKDIIGSKLEAKFIDKIFDGDMLEYFKKLDEFEDMDSWREAAAKADELFARKSIDPDSSIANDFYDAIKKRFEKE